MVVVAWVAMPTRVAAQTAPANHKIPLIGGHAKLACAACHDRGTGMPPSRGTNCRDCHQRGHDTDFSPDCQHCHGAIEWLSVPEPLAREAHAKTPYPLAGKHRAAPCAGCHLPTTPAKDRFRLVSHDKCLSCHDDKHGGEFAATQLGDCARCHTNDGFDRTTFGVAAHAVTAFKLDGKHVATPCRSCHPSRTSFLVGGSACLDCHDNPHGTRFATELTAGGCASCHDTGDWRTPHVPHPTFALAGKHARTPCASCHGAKPADADPAAYRGIPRDCGGCHRDVHAGQFATPQDALGASGAGLPAKPCGDCHDASAWTPSKLDHRATRYPLEGIHTTLACDACHPKTTLRDGSTATRYRLGYFTCSSCHASPHPSAAFTRTVECNACHATTGWPMAATAATNPDAAAFDHDRTRLPLRGSHRATACTQCHAGAAKPATACEGCHRDPHQGRTQGACAECHNAVAWTATQELEQHRRTRMPLTGRHAVIECNACHTRQSGERTWTDLPTDCYACHAGEYHSATPPHQGDPNDPSVQPFSRECGLCHTAIAWSPATLDPGQLAPRLVTTGSRSRRRGIAPPRARAVTSTVAAWRRCDAMAATPARSCRRNTAPRSTRTRAVVCAVIREARGDEEEGCGRRAGGRCARRVRGAEARGRHRHGHRRRPRVHHARRCRRAARRRRGAVRRPHAGRRRGSRSRRPAVRLDAAEARHRRARCRAGER